MYPDGTKPPELDNISLKSDCVQEKSKVSKKFTPIGNDELDALIDSKDPFDLSRLDTDSHTHIYNLDDEKRSDASSFTSKDFNITSSGDPVTSEKSEKIEMETSMNHPAVSDQPPSESLKFSKSDRDSPGPDTCKINRLSYNQALKDEVIQSDKSSTSSSTSSSSSSSSSDSTKSATFNDTSEGKSDGTHKSSFVGKKGSFFPNIFNNICKGPDTKSVDLQDEPESLPNDQLSCAEVTVTSSSRPSIRVSKDTTSISSKKSSKPSSEKKSKPSKMPMCPPFGKKHPPSSPVLEKAPSPSPPPKPKRSPQVIHIPLVDPEIEAEPLDIPVQTTPEMDPIHLSDSIPVCQMDPASEEIPSIVDDTVEQVEATPEVDICAIDPEIKLSHSLDLANKSESDKDKDTTSNSTTSKESPQSSLKLESSIKLSLPVPSVRDTEIETSIKSFPKVAKEISTKGTSKTSHVLKSPLEIHPKAVRVHGDKKKRPFSLCGLGKPDISEDEPKAKSARPRSCFGGQPSADISSDSDDKDDTLKDGHSICSVDSFVISSSLVRPPVAPPLIPRQLKVGVNPNGSLMVDDNGCLLDPDGNPLVYIGPDGSEDPKFHPALGPVVGPDGAVYGPNGQPLLSPDGEPVVLSLRPLEPLPLVPVPPDENGNLLGPDGEPLIGPDGNPLKCLVDVCIPYIDPAGILHGPDKEPIRDPESGEPIQIKLNPDGSIPLDEDGNIIDEEGNVVRPSDPIKPGRDPLSVVVIAPDGGVIGPDGQPVKNDEGEPIKTLCPCGDIPLQVNDVGELLDADGLPIIVEEIPVVPMVNFILPEIRPDGSVLDPESNLPVISPEGIPLLVGLRPDPDFVPLDMVPSRPNDEGILVDENGFPLLGPDGDPIKCPPVEIGCPYISNDGTLHGPDKMPLINPKTGGSIKIKLNPDGSLPIDDDGNIVDENGDTIPELKLGELPLGDVIICPDGQVIGPDGKPLLDCDGEPIKVAHPDSGNPLTINDNGDLLDTKGNPIPLPGTDTPVKPILHSFSCPHVRPDGSLYDLGKPMVTYDLPDEEPEYAVPEEALPLGEEVGQSLQQAVDLSVVESCPHSAAPTPPPRAKKNKRWSGWNPCTRGQPDRPVDDAGVDSSAVCSETQTTSKTKPSSTSSDSATKPALLGGLFDKIRGRKKERSTPKLKRSASTPASLYSSTESLIVVTYRIRKKRGQSAPPQAKKRRPTLVTIDCSYGDAPAHLSPMYVADVVGTFDSEEKVPAPEVVSYHDNILDRIRQFKDEPPTGPKENQSHIFTSCHCSTTATRSSVGIGTGCDVVQHEQFEYIPNAIDPE